MPDERAASEAARRKKAADRKGTTPATAKPAQARQPVPRPPAARPGAARPGAAQVARPLLPAEPVRKPTWLRIVGWIAFLAAVVLFAVFVVLWVRGDISKTQQLYPLPGIASGFLIIGIWTALGPWLYRSRGVAARAGKYVLAGVITIAIYPAVVTLVGALAEYIVTLIPGSPLH